MQRLEEYLIKDNSGARVKELADFFETAFEDPETLMNDQEKLNKIVTYVRAIASELEKSNYQNLDLTNVLADNIRHVSYLVSQQQSNTKHSGLIQEFSATEAIQDVLRLSSIDLEKNKIEVMFNGDQDIQIKSDRHKLLQIITNIITNAIQAIQISGHEGKIRITQSCDRDQTFNLL